MSQRLCDCIELSKWVRSSDKNSKIDSNFNVKSREYMTEISFEASRIKSWQSNVNKLHYLPLIMPVIL